LDILVLCVHGLMLFYKCVVILYSLAVILQQS
jgi:hypothetical protein